VLRLIRDRALGGRGIGYVDAHLLAAFRSSAGVTWWTRDKRLFSVARELSLASL
jgi:predicted nucleic acid-binding protein